MRLISAQNGLLKPSLERGVRPGGKRESWRGPNRLVGGRRGSWRAGLLLRSLFGSVAVRQCRSAGLDRITYAAGRGQAEGSCCP